tara:strand:+ start:4598 stop:5170 length:573 start_codon:yes stop_codon:yes gene_type:complete
MANLFYDIKTYVDYDNLEKARVLFKQELDEFIKDYSIVQQIGMDLDTYYKTGVKDNWRNIPIKVGDPGMDNELQYADKFPKTLEVVEQCKGLTNIGMNFTKPHGKIVPHSDPYDKDKDGNIIKHITFINGVIIPSDKVNECGMKFNDTTIYLAESEWVGFSPETKHSSWNYTDHYRLSIIATIDSKYLTT